jgi:haloacetate dehalogenase
MGQCYDVLDTWQEKCEDVSGKAIPGGHFLAEEAPQETYRALSEFY